VDLDLLAQTQRVILAELENHGQQGWSQDSEADDSYYDSPVEIIAKQDLEELDTLLDQYLAAEQELEGEED
jgi:hypothetical protein